MAKPNRARRQHLPSPRRYTYTPELLASGRHRYEHTEETITDIAVDFGIHRTTFQRMANREGWVRHVAPPRDLPTAVKLAAAAARLAATLPTPERGRSPSEARRVGVTSSDTEVSPTPTLTLPLAGGGNDGAAPRDASAPAADPTPPIPESAEDLHRAVLAELATVKAMRARMRGEAQKPADADVTARTLARLTATLRDVQHMQRAHPPLPGADHDDMPADIDAFRYDLARRIDSFVASRTEPADDGGDPAAPADPA